MKIEIDRELLSQIEKLSKTLDIRIEDALNLFTKTLTSPDDLQDKKEADTEDPNKEFKDAVRRLREQSAHLNITLEEINEEIAAVRAEKDPNYDYKKVLRKLREESAGINMSMEEIIE